MPMSDRIVLLSTYSKNNAGVFDLTAANHQDYAKKWCLDVLTIQEPYSPHNNFEELRNLLKIYKTVISVGTDILFTDFSTDIRKFNKESYPIVIQEETEGATVNGDFIYFNRALLKVVERISVNDKTRKTSQKYINSLRNTTDVFVHPPRTIQSMNPFDDRDWVRRDAWVPGDFSVHMNNPGHKPNVSWKIDALNRFLMSYGRFTHCCELSDSSADSQ